MALVLDGSAGTVSGLGVPAPGMVLIEKKPFTAVSSVSLDGCFTSAYNNYKVVVRFTSWTSGAYGTLRMRASGTDASGSDYSYSGHYHTSAPSSATGCGA
jgi:hypothetical protein